MKGPFDTPAHTSYIDLCLPLPHLRVPKPGQEGGIGRWYLTKAPDEQAWHGPECIGSFTRADLPWVGDSDVVWLPLLHEWLDMLAEVDMELTHVLFNQPRFGADRGKVQAMCSFKGAMAIGATREEATARLWMAVT